MNFIKTKFGLLIHLLISFIILTIIINFIQDNKKNLENSVKEKQVLFKIKNNKNI